jgi:hypothetical protein
VVTILTVIMETVLLLVVVVGETMAERMVAEAKRKNQEDLQELVQVALLPLALEDIIPTATMGFVYRNLQQWWEQ